MTYEYEKENKKAVMINPPKANRELQEVYCKAQAWDALKELLIKEYPEVTHLADISNGEWERGEMSKHEEVLERMDKLDGTNEFSNLLRDLEDE